MIRVRIAPSPTGNLHVGTAQSALYNWLFAKKNNGQFFVRIEDTDEERSDKKYEEDILSGLEWLGINWDGSVTRSSENRSKYRGFLEGLLNSGKAFWCDHSKEELEAEQKRQISMKEAPRHICLHKKDQLSDGQVIRLNVDTSSEREIKFDDEVRGEVVFKEKLIGDFAIARNLDSALYHFAVVIDDIAMDITHVLRGEDHISNTPKHILIYEALGKPIPRFAHLPLLLGSDRSKLSKRNSQTSLNEYKNDYLPEAMVNFLGAISHTYSKEILTRKELVSEFDLKKIHKSGAVFNIDKLNWLNSQYIKQLNNLTIKQLTNLTEIPDAAIPLITERLEKLSDIQNFDYFWKEPNYDSNLLDWPPRPPRRDESRLGQGRASLAKGGKNFSRDEIRSALMEVKMLLESWDWDNFDEDALRLALDDLGKKLGDPAKSQSDRGASRGLVYWPFRVALTGREKSPDPVEVAAVLDKEVVLRRVGEAIRKLN